ncbi:ABC transporter substrate-binding protein [Mesorhizobium sp.]|uniref:substrate-binding periplasmic protein n=1 Tax=Mesorhizobium sp. TaxID=1871066 RepID=UPI0025E0C494|nr:transporter substrate-binding domain-containing protein [Mesorhizobium sp.]
MNEQPQSGAMGGNEVHKKASVFLTALSAVAALVGLAAGHARADTLDDIRARGKLEVGVGIMGLKPIIWQNPDGTYSGYEYDMLQYILQKIGVKDFEYVNTEWTTLLPGLKSNRWDLVFSGVAITQERATGGDAKFTRPYFMYLDYVIVPKSSTYQNLADLKGKTAASVLGTMDSLTAHNLADKGAFDQVKDFNTFGEPFVALRNGQVDAVVIDQTTLKGQQDTMGDLRVLAGPYFYEPKPELKSAEDKAPYKLGAVGIAVRSNDERLLAALNGAIADMYADGTNEKILKKYGVWDPALANPLK